MGRNRNVRKNQKSNDQKPIHFGNWFWPIEQSSAARGHYRVFEAKVGYDPAKAREQIQRNAAIAVAADLYLAPLPRAIATLIRTDRGLVRAMYDEVTEALESHRGYNPVYLGRASLPAELRNDAVRIGNGFWLVGRQVTMPLERFLYFYWSDCPREVLTEWSGIPESLQEEAYEAIILYLRKELVTEHRFAEAYGQPIELSTVRGINIYNSHVQIYTAEQR